MIKFAELIVEMTGTFTIEYKNILFPIYDPTVEKNGRCPCLSDNKPTNLYWIYMFNMPVPFEVNAR